LDELFEGKYSDIEGNCLNEKADGLLKLIIHDEKNKQESCSFMSVDVLVFKGKRMDQAHN
jgi:hypothetical protein